MPSGARGSVLVVEDDAETRLAYRGLLEHGGWSVHEAADGAEALAVAARIQPRVAIVDLAIPRIDGWETVRRLQLDERTRGVAVIVVTGHALDEDRRRARELGCAEYLVKPVSPPELMAAVARLATAVEREARA